MHPRERLAYSSIEDRPPLKFPKGVRMVIWPVLALEEWDMSRPMARMVISPPQGQPQQPDHPNWSWHEYGMRVGFWRLRKVFRASSASSPTVTLNARVCETYPAVVKACIDDGWELNAHGYDQVPMHKLDDQRAVIMKSMDLIEKFSGKRPRGWFGPGLTQTFDTLDYLSEAGVEYIGDWVLDDEPVTLKTTHKPVVALPYNFEIHDIVHDGAAVPSLRRHVRARARPVRVALRGSRRTAEDHGDRLPSLSVRRAAPHRPRAADVQGTFVARGRRRLERRQDPRLVSDAKTDDEPDFPDSTARPSCRTIWQSPIAGAASGPLAGLTAAVKDMYDIAGYRISSGNPTWLETTPPATKTAGAVQSILDAGATVIGKTVCDEFFFSVTGANAHYGTPVNPRAPGRLPGGSSSGSASAVASGTCDFALGSDTGGSVRIPACV